MKDEKILLRTTMHSNFILIIFLFVLNTSESKDRDSVIDKSKQSERNNIILSPPFGPPNVPSTSGTHQSSSKALSTSSEFQRRPVDFLQRNGAKPDDTNFCEISKEAYKCSELDGDCIECDFEITKNTCIYGKNVTISCQAKEKVLCQGERYFEKEIVCQYCYQTPVWQQKCNGMAMCNSVGAPRNYFRANCTVAPEILCLGNRRFERMIPCNWKNGYKWSTALFLSITLGGFGADRFYLGRWQEGIGKLFSFGGLGLWTFVDIILIAVRYLGPADGSIYVD